VLNKKTIGGFMSNKKEILFKDLSYKIIGACFKVHSRLGSCLPEHVYQRALELEFAELGIPYTSQQQLPVHYRDQHIGHFFSDLIVDNKIILELKVDDRFTIHHQAQLFTYLRVAGLHVGYLVNFGLKSLAFKRLIL
jgi:GxxExxY protein